jgi:hypothetical protein
MREECEEERASLFLCFLLPSFLIAPLRIHLLERNSLHCYLCTFFLCTHACTHANAPRKIDQLVVYASSPLIAFRARFLRPPPPPLSAYLRVSACLLSMHALALTLALPHKLALRQPHTRQAFNMSFVALVCALAAVALPVSAFPGNTSDSLTSARFLHFRLYSLRRESSPCSHFWICCHDIQTKICTLFHQCNSLQPSNLPRATPALDACSSFIIPLPTSEAPVTSPACQAAP